jgi:myo-inositol 2-dehydrogenase/D-chiro-inositol 1-dehydrogenase
MNRRKFIAKAASASGLLLVKQGTAFGYRANSAVQLGLLGCGGRGTVVANSLSQNTSARIVALADLFPDRLASAKSQLDALNASLGGSSIDSAFLFRGPHAYQEISNAPQVDAVQIATPPWFHVQHLEAVVKAGKHVYCEKPICVDVPQAKKAMEIGQSAGGKVSIDVGFQLRSAPPFVELVRRIRGGNIGKIACISAHYDAPEVKGVALGPGASTNESRLRNWLWYRALSGDILVEQNIHVIDICNWILMSHPIKAIATGGRNVTSHPGDTWDNYQVSFTYPDAIHLSFSSTQFGSQGWFDVAQRIFGSNGVAEAPYSGPVRIIGENAWTWKSQDPEEHTPHPSTFASNGVFHDNLAFADSEKDKAFIQSIVSGSYHNQVSEGVESALSCILGRMAAEQDREVSWDEMLKSDEAYPLGIDLSMFS